MEEWRWGGKRYEPTRVPVCRGFLTKGPFVARFAQQSQGQVQLDDMYLVALAKQGSPDAMDRIVRR